MIHSNEHRVIAPLQKDADKGQSIHFLIGDGIGDNFFYDLYNGCQSLEDTLGLYYLKHEELYDYLICVRGSEDNVICRQLVGNSVQTIDFWSIFGKPKVDCPFAPGFGRDDSETPEVAVQSNNVTVCIERLSTLLKKNEKRVLLLLDGLEWIACLHDGPVRNSWIAALKRWETMKTLMAVITIKDIELIEKYNFDQEPIFIGNPGAAEISSAYLRFLLRKSNSSYNLDLAALDDIAQCLSVGKKKLHNCMNILRRVFENNKERLCKEDFESSFELNIEEKVTWESVRLDKCKKDEIESYVNKFLENEESLKGVILTGPPGTGKTMLAKALATEKQCYFMAPTLADMKGEYIGQSSAKIKRIFAEARANEPTILFIDEADTVFPSRSADSHSSDSYAKDMVNQFLVEIDGAKTGKQRIFIIAATNRPEALDAAIKSRLAGRPLDIPLPTKEMRGLIFEDNLSKDGQKFELKGKRYEEFVLEKSEGFSGRDIANLCKKFLTKAKGASLYDVEFTDRLFRELFADLESTNLKEMTDIGVLGKDNVVAPSENKLTFDDIIGYDDIKEEMRQQADYIRGDAALKNKFIRENIVPSKGILMYGPPGNAKSELAQAAAGEFGFYLFKVLSKDFASIYPSEQIKRLDEIFSRVNRFTATMSRCPGVILFFDEFDALCGQNILSTEVRGSLLNYIADSKGLRSKDSKIMFLAATNFYELLDEASIRRGRIDVHKKMDNPTIENGILMLKKFFRDKDKTGSSDQISDEILRAIYSAISGEIIKEEKERIRQQLRSLGRRRFEIDSYLEDFPVSKRPSGADLKMLVEDLRNIAFRELLRREENAGTTQNIEITMDIVKRRFPNFSPESEQEVMV